MCSEVNRLSLEKLFPARILRKTTNTLTYTDSILLLCTSLRHKAPRQRQCSNYGFTPSRESFTDSDSSLILVARSHETNYNHLRQSKSQRPKDFSPFVAAHLICTRLIVPLSSRLVLPERRFVLSKPHLLVQLSSLKDKP